MRARPVAMALLALLAGGLPVLALAAFFFSGKLKGLRRAVACRLPWGNGLAQAGSAPLKTRGAPVPPITAAGLLATALENKDLRPRAQWLVAHDWALTALCTAATSYAATATSLESYLAYQLGMAAALMGTASLLWRIAPNVERARWQNTAQVALFALAGVSAGANVALRHALERGGAGALSLCATLLAAAGCVCVLLLAQWWRALGALRTQLALTARSGARDGAEGAVLGRGAGGMVVRATREKETRAGRYELEAGAEAGLIWALSVRRRLG